MLEKLIFSELNEFEAHTNLPGGMPSFSHRKNVLQKIMEGIDLLKQNQTFWMTSKYALRPAHQRFFSFISKYALLNEDDTSGT